MKLKSNAICNKRNPVTDDFATAIVQDTWIDTKIWARIQW